MRLEALAQRFENETRTCVGNVLQLGAQGFQIAIPNRLQKTRGGPNPDIWDLGVPPRPECWDPTPLLWKTIEYRLLYGGVHPVSFYDHSRVQVFHPHVE